MTKYYPVTEEELNIIKNDCAHPETDSCKGCEFDSLEPPICRLRGSNVLMDEVMERMDPLEVLKAWRIWFSAKMPMDTLSWAHETPFIKELQDDPQAVVEKGKKEGWLK